MCSVEDLSLHLSPYRTQRGPLLRPIPVRSSPVASELRADYNAG